MFRPKHTAISVARSLSLGLKDGSVVLRRAAEPERLAHSHRFSLDMMARELGKIAGLLGAAEFARAQEQALLQEWRDAEYMAVALGISRSAHVVPTVLTSNRLWKDELAHVLMHSPELLTRLAGDTALQFLRKMVQEQDRSSGVSKDLMKVLLQAWKRDPDRSKSTERLVEFDRVLSARVNAVMKDIMSTETLQNVQAYVSRFYRQYEAEGKTIDLEMEQELVEMMHGLLFVTKLTIALESAIESDPLLAEDRKRALAFYRPWMAESLAKAWNARDVK